MTSLNVSFGGVGYGTMVGDYSINLCSSRVCYQRGSSIYDPNGHNKRFGGFGYWLGNSSTGKVLRGGDYNFRQLEWPRYAMSTSFTFLEVGDVGSLVGDSGTYGYTLGSRALDSLVVLNYQSVYAGDVG